MEDPGHDSTTDEVLVRQALDQPDSPQAKDAVAELLGRYQLRIYHWCFGYMRDHEQALDLAQETLLRAYDKLGSFRGRARFSSWLFAIARNRCLKAMRRAAYQRERASLPGQVPDPGPSPDRILEEKMDERAVLELIHSRLNTQEQDVIWMRCFEKLPVDEITGLLGISGSSGARAVLQRARRKLRTALAERPV
jgi:RNA polymerase sigma-70 factor (ECF subfamily)